MTVNHMELCVHRSTAHESYCKGLSELDTQAPGAACGIISTGLTVSTAVSLCGSQAASPALQMEREGSLRNSIMRRKAGPVVKSMAALPEDQGSVPGTHTAAHICHSNSRGLTPSSGFCTHTSKHS